MEWGEFQDKFRKMKYTRIEILTSMKKLKLVPLFYNSDVCKSKKILKACYDGGARVIEFTSRGNCAPKVFEELVSYSRNTLPNLMLGVGSVTSAAETFKYMSLGASFIVTPTFIKEIAVICNRKKMLWIPGCGSLKEIFRAVQLGCEVVKLFPASVYGPEFVKAIKGPCPWINIMPTGGIHPTKESLYSWLKVGVFSVGVGSELIKKKWIENDDYEQITIAVKKSITLLKCDGE